MRLANVRGRAVLLGPDGGVDVYTASEGRFGPDVTGIYRRWTEFDDWGRSVDVGRPDHLARQPTPGPADVAAPVTEPRQVFAIGLNYRAHARESGIPVPRVPLVFTKFATAIAGPYADIPLPTDQTDWEAEVAVVIGATARRVARADGWRHVAGVTAAQDYSARDVQFDGGSTPQFSLAKSFPRFAPLGPVLVTPDEFADPDSIRLECAVNGTTVQAASTADLIFAVPDLIAYLSSVVTLLPGDVILTGTPSGVGFGHTPPRYLKVGDEVVTRVEGVGEMRHRCVPVDGPLDRHGREP